MSNPFKGVDGQLNGSVYDMIPVTTSDVADNVGTGNVAVGLYITVAGDVTFHNKYGTSRTVTVPANFYLICSVKRVLTTGTTATGIHAMVV
tara:strand:+ start:600 stop:872 length:273 start_codon:yes stop_codon:yes gene_type:complete